MSKKKNIPKKYRLHIDISKTSEWVYLVFCHKLNSIVLVTTKMQTVYDYLIENTPRFGMYYYSKAMSDQLKIRQYITLYRQLYPMEAKQTLLLTDCTGERVDYEIQKNMCYVVGNTAEITNKKKRSRIAKRREKKIKKEIENEK